MTQIQYVEPQEDHIVCVIVQLADVGVFGYVDAIWHAHCCTEVLYLRLQHSVYRHASETVTCGVGEKAPPDCVPDGTPLHTEHTYTHQMLCCRITTLTFYIFNKF